MQNNAKYYLYHISIHEILWVKNMTDNIKFSESIRQTKSKINLFHLDALKQIGMQIGDV